MGRIITGYFGTYCSKKNDQGNYFDTNHDGGVSNFWDGDRHSILKCQNVGVYAGAGISNNNSGKYLYNGYGYSVDASAQTPRGMMLSNNMYSGFGTFTPTATVDGNTVEDIVEMASDEYPTYIKFISLPLYRPDGMVTGDPGNDWGRPRSPSVLLYAFKNDFSDYTYNNGKRKWNEAEKRDIVTYNPKEGAIILYNESSAKADFYPTDAVFRKDLGDEGKKLQGKKLGLFRDGGTSWTQWRGFHKVEISTNYVPYTVTIGQGTNGTGIMPQGGGVSSISASRNEVIALQARPNDAYVSTGWIAPPNSIASTGGNNYIFTMPSPAENVTITPTFKKQEYSITVGIDNTEAGSASCEVSTSEWDEDRQLSYEITNSLYRFNGWEVRDKDNNSIIVSAEGLFKMPKSDVTVTAHTLKHEIVCENSNLDVDQDNYTLTFTKNDDARDTFGETLTFELYRNNTKVADFNENTAVVTLNDNDIGVSYNYKVIAHSETDNITSEIVTIDGYVVYRVELATSPSEGGTVAAKCGAKTVSIAHPGKTITLEYVPDGLYVFNNWTAPDGVVITDKNEFSMPSKNVTITAVFAKHKITWENASLTVKQNEYNLTFTKGGTVSDSNGISFSFKLLRNGVDLGVTFTEDTATYKMSDAEVEKEYEYTVIAYSLEDEVSTTGATITFRSQGVHKTIGYFDGTEFVPCVPYYYNGEDWVEVYPHYYDGAEWVLCSMT